jgi:CDP-glucose 4,6-dehydratase
MTDSTGTNWWQDRPTLVTGATGLVGSWLVPGLLGRGAAAVCLVRDWVPGSELVRGDSLARATVVRGELEDQPLLERVLGEYEINTIIHLAAQTLVPVANRNPVSTFQSNIAGTWNLLEAARRSPTVGQIVIASSDKAYGSAEKLPYTEQTPLRAEHPYDVSKSCADLIAHAYARTYQLPVVITRCGNIYGGGDLNWNRIVPGTIRSLIRHQRPIIRSNGQLTRDYFYVNDAVEAYLMLAERLAADRGLIGQAFNFSNDQPLSVLQIVEQITRVMGSDLEPEVLNQASGEIADQYLDATRARTRLGWAPRYGLERGLRETIEWYRQYLSDGP